MFYQSLKIIKAFINDQCFVVNGLPFGSKYSFLGWPIIPLLDFLDIFIVCSRLWWLVCPQTSLPKSVGTFSGVLMGVFARSVTQIINAVRFTESWWQVLYSLKMPFRISIPIRSNWDFQLFNKASQKWKT